MGQKKLTLEPGETLLWEGRPSVRRSVVASAPLFVLGIALSSVCLYAFHRETEATHQGGLWVLACFALLCVTAPGQAWFAANRTRYVLTNRRAVVLEPWLVKFGRVDSIRVPDWKLEVVPGRIGSGDIAFATFGMGGRLGFKHLADISVVERLVRDLAGQSHPAAPGNSAHPDSPK